MAYVEQAGYYSIHVYGDDTLTTPMVDEGAVNGDEITFYLNCDCPLIAENLWVNHEFFNEDLADGAQAPLLPVHDDQKQAVPGTLRQLPTADRRSTAQRASHATRPVIRPAARSPMRRSLRRIGFDSLRWTNYLADRTSSACTAPRRRTVGR